MSRQHNPRSEFQSKVKTLANQIFVTRIDMAERGAFADDELEGEADFAIRAASIFLQKLHAEFGSEEESIPYLD